MRVATTTSTRKEQLTNREHSGNIARSWTGGHLATRMCVTLERHP